MKQKPHKLFQVSQKIIFYNPVERKFLLVKDSETESEVSTKYGAWEFPGGRIDEDENVEENLKREITEEIGGDVQYTIKYLVGDYFYFLQDGDRIGLVYLGMYQGGEIVLSDEHSEYRWQTLDEIEKSKEYHEWLKKVVRNAAQSLKNEEYLTDLKRVQADFENYKKRQQETQKMLGGYLIEKLVLDIVPVLDNFRQATLHVPSEQKDSPWVVGIQYIEKQLETVLTDNGVQMIEVKAGQEFDPTIHEAIEMQNENIKMKNDEEATEEEKPVEAKEHTVAKVIQKGYKFGDRVIRPAKVIVK